MMRDYGLILAGMMLLIALYADVQRTDEASACRERMAACTKLA